MHTPPVACPDPQNTSLIPSKNVFIAARARATSVFVGRGCKRVKGMSWFAGSGGGISAGIKGELEVPEVEGVRSKSEVEETPEQPKFPSSDPYA